MNFEELQRHFNDGQAFYNAGRYREALTEFELVENDPALPGGRASLLWNMAMCLVQLGDNAAASVRIAEQSEWSADSFWQAARAHGLGADVQPAGGTGPLTDEEWQGLATIATETRADSGWDAVEPVLAETLRRSLSPEQAQWVHYRMAQALAAQGKWDEALTHLGPAGTDETTFRIDMAEIGFGGTDRDRKAELRAIFTQAKSDYDLGEWQAAYTAFCSILEEPLLEDEIMRDVRFNAAVCAQLIGEHDRAQNLALASGAAWSEVQAVVDRASALL
jgi:tetratricopeptide (TPR) repeat protein